MRKQSENPARLARIPDNPNTRHGGKETTMKHILVVVASLLVAIFTLTAAPQMALAGDCPQCNMLPTPAQRAACVCPTAPKPPPPGPVTKYCKKLGKKVPLKQWSKALCEATTVVVKECKPECGKNERCDDGSCMCDGDFEWLGEGDEKTCVERCKAGEERNLNTGECELVTECVDPCAIAAAEKADLHHGEVKTLLTAPRAFDWLLWVIATLLLAILGLMGTWFYQTRNQRRLAELEAKDQLEARQEAEEEAAREQRQKDKEVWEARKAKEVAEAAELAALRAEKAKRDKPTRSLAPKKGKVKKVSLKDDDPGDEPEPESDDGDDDPPPAKD